MADPTEDARLMGLALALGRRELGQTWPNPAVGAVLVRDGVIVGRGWTQHGGRPHAEPQALARAGEAARGATLYVTLEPCSHYGRTPPCADAIIAAGVKRVVSAMTDPNPDVAGAGHWRMGSSGVQVEVGVGEDEARRAHAGHVRRIGEGRPHVTLKLAVSADGKVGLPGRRPVAITGEAANARVHLMRAENDAVLTGIGTVLADNPLLTCRLPGMEKRSPVRVVLDGSLRLPTDSRIVASAGDALVWVFTNYSPDEGRKKALNARRVDVIGTYSERRKLDLRTMLEKLAKRGVTRLMVEAGPIVAASFVNANLVDEVALFRSPTPLGEGIDALDGLPLEALTRSPRLVLAGTETLGADTLEHYWRP